MKTMLMPLALILANPHVLRAGSVAGTGGSTEVTQIMNNAQLIQQTSEMYDQTRKLMDQLRKQKEMVDDMKKHGKTLSGQEWSHTSQDLKKLSDVVRQGEAIAYSSANLDGLYRQKYKGYGAYAKENSGTASTYSDRYASWSDTNRDSIVGAMKSANLQAAQFDTEEDAMRTIENMGRSSQGRMEAIQVGNLIASQQVGQMQKLRGLVMAQMQMQSSFLAFEANQKDSSNAKSRNFFQNDLSGINVNDGKKF